MDLVDGIKVPVFFFRFVGWFGAQWHFWIFVVFSLASWDSPVQLNNMSVTGWLKAFHFASKTWHTKPLDLKQLETLSAHEVPLECYVVVSSIATMVIAKECKSDIIQWDIILEENETVIQCDTLWYIVIRWSTIIHKILCNWSHLQQFHHFGRLWGWDHKNPGTIWKAKFAQEGRVVGGIFWGGDFLGASPGECFCWQLLTHDFSMAWIQRFFNSCRWLMLFHVSSAWYSTLDVGCLRPRALGWTAGTAGLLSSHAPQLLFFQEDFRQIKMINNWVSWSNHQWFQWFFGDLGGEFVPLWYSWLHPNRYPNILFLLKPCILYRNYREWESILRPIVPLSNDHPYQKPFFLLLFLNHIINQSNHHP